MQSSRPASSEFDDRSFEKLRQYLERVQEELISTIDDQDSTFVRSPRLAKSIQEAVVLSLSGVLFPPQRAAALRTIALPTCTRCLEERCEEGSTCRGNTVSLTGTSNTDMTTIMLYHYKSAPPAAPPPPVIIIIIYHTYRYLPGAIIY